MKKGITPIYHFLLISLILCALPTFAQEIPKPINEMTKEEILELTYEELIALPFSDLIYVANEFQLSADELLDYFLNKEVKIASKEEENSFESPLSTTVITAEEIQRSGASTIEEIFRLIPGMIVREQTNGNFDIHIRGNDNVPPDNFSVHSINTMTLVMIDGMPIYNYINGGTFWETIPLGINDIERVEMVRGPSSALYGANAVSGVINFITKKTEGNKLKISGSLLGGNSNSYITNLAFEKGFGKFKIRVGGNYEHRDRFQTDFYSFAQADYVEADDLISLFGRPYFASRRGGKDPEVSKEKLGYNAGLFYNVNEKIKFSLHAGTQASYVQSVFFETLATPLTLRETNNNYVRFNADVANLHADVSLLYGVQDLAIGINNMVIKYNMSTLNSLLEYNIKPLENLSIRPGVHFQQAIYDDSEWVDYFKVHDNKPDIKGMLNGENTLSTAGFSLRTDFTAFTKLRIAAAGRYDIYNIPAKNYFSYQFMVSYKANNNLIFRAVASRANRSAFMADAFATFQNNLGPQQPQQTFMEFPPNSGNYVPVTARIDAYYQYYVGEEKLDLLTMDMLEVGIKSKITKNIQAEIESFYTQTNNYDVLTPIGKFYQVTGLSPTYDTIYMNVHDSLVYTNLDVVSKQFGVTTNVQVYVNEKLQLRFFGTYQQTKLENFVTTEDTLNMNYKGTPSFYGGFSADYQFTPKLSIHTNSYFYTQHNYSRYQSPFGEENETEINTKFILNLKLGYYFYKQNEVFINVRNILNDKSVEFGFSDSIGSLFLIGLNIQI